MDKFTVGVVGLGLMGGSLAKAYTAAGHTVLGANRSPATVGIAKLQGAIADELTPDRLKECDIIYLCTMPASIVQYLRDNADNFGDAVVIDCGGVKRNICKEGFAIAKEHGFLFVGGHPMAGSQKGGYKNSRDNLYKGASMIIVPPVTDDILLLERIKNLVIPAGFGKVTVTTAENHDRMIAFTSQLAHIVSNAYIKSPASLEHRGFSAGSFKDLTRVAYLDPDMWTELFLENSDNVVNELDIIIKSLSEYRDAVASGDAAGLRELLAEGRRMKEESLRSTESQGSAK